MDSFLTPVSTTVTGSIDREPLIEVSKHHSNEQPERASIASPDEIDKILKEQPDLESVGNILKYLVAESGKKDGFHLAIPGPVSAQIVNTLVKTTIPDYWKTMKEHKSYDKQLVRCFQNVNGLGAVISRLRLLINDSRGKKAVDGGRDSTTYIEDLIDILEQILSGDRTCIHIWIDIQKHAQSETQRKLVWKEYIAQIASGRILALVAEANDVLKQRESLRRTSWLANGNDYASWFGRNLAILMKDSLDLDHRVSAVADICGKALMLGYTDRIVGAILSFMINDESVKILGRFLPKLKAHEQRKYLNSIVASLTKQWLIYHVDDKKDMPIQASPLVSAAASLLHTLTMGSELMKDHLITVLTQSIITALDDSLIARRSVITTIAQDEGRVQDLLEKGLKLFGDSFFVTHAPILQQEALAQTLMVTCGYVHRSQPMFLVMMAKSSYHSMGMSNRIGATSLRARFLGMAVGMAISKLVDKPDLQLNFEVEGDQASEAKWYQQLTQVNDRLGNINDLQVQERKDALLTQLPKKGYGLKKRNKPAIDASAIPTLTEISGPRIVEILDNSSDEDNDMVPYEKPDSDPEDDTDDPTEINRNKPTAPVYIRDLLAGLRDQENYDRHQLALSTAASLIRRKTNFGSEVTDHVEDLASVLTGLNDNLDLPDFDQQRQQALIAVLLARPKIMAQWFARSFFSGDYSLTQRIAMLTTLGLGARELAGLEESSMAANASAAFPSSKLPPHLHKIYAPETDSVARITTGLTKQILSPIAARAADQLSGPNVLKVRTFSSRMEVEQRRSKPIPNALAQIVADSFFFPLTGRWWMATRSSSSPDNVYTSIHLLPPFLHTLAILLHASGPNTVSLSQMTRELWELLLSVRTVAANDKVVLSALLFAFLMLLETNEDKELVASQQSKELLETQEWVRLVFENLGAGSDEDERVRVLAAGVLVRCQEVVEKYQRRLAGVMMDY